jgi:hypothetical protein
MKKTLKPALLLLLFTFFIISCTTSKTSVKADEQAAVSVSSSISGVVLDMKDDKPIEGAYVYAYKSASRGQMGPSDFISNPTNAKGEFSFDVAPEEYYVIARKREDGSNVGVLSTGDYSSPTGIKVKVAGNSDAVVTIKIEEIVEPMFFKKTGAEITSTGIKGFIYNKKGSPVAGAFVIAYRDKKMKKLPEFASVPTQSDGSYVLYLPTGGKYYIAARTNTKSPPVKGEYYGTYDGCNDHSVNVIQDLFIKDINITLMPFTGSPESDFKGFK